MIFFNPPTYRDATYHLKLLYIALCLFAVCVRIYSQIVKSEIHDKQEGYLGGGGFTSEGGVTSEAL